MIDETNYVRIDSKDNVIVSLEDLKKRTEDLYARLFYRSKRRDSYVS